MVLNTQVLNSFIISLQVMYALLVAFLVIRSVFIVTWWVNESLSLPNQYSFAFEACYTFYDERYFQFI